MFLSLTQKTVKCGLCALTLLVSASAGSALAQQAPANLTDITPAAQDLPNPQTEAVQNTQTPLDRVFPEDINREPANTADPFNNQTTDGSDLNDPITRSRQQTEQDGLTDQENQSGQGLVVERDDSPRRNRRVRRADPVSIIGPDGAPTPLANSRQPAVQGGNVIREENPFAALGLRVGSFTLFPVLTQRFGYTSNADFAAGGEPSGFSQTDLRISGNSNWARHELRGEIGGDYEAFFNGTSDDLPNVDGNIELRLDLTQDWTARLGAVGNLTTEGATSGDLSVPDSLTVENRPQLAVYGAYAEIDRQAGRIDTRLRGTFTRSQYGDAELSDGSDQSQKDRNNNLYELTGRIGYDSSPSFRPFVEGTIGTRDYDHTVDRNGEQRSSKVAALRAGIAFDRSEILNGELAVGYARETLDDDNLKPLEGVTVNGVINWSPQRFTTISSTVQTRFNESSNIGESGSITYAGTIGITRDVRPDLALNAQFLASLESYVGSSREDRTLQVQAGAEWRLNRMVAIIGDIGYENVDSTDNAASYDAVTGRIGLRLQR